jgi:hypothetical protein
MSKGGFIKEYKLVVVGGWLAIFVERHSLTFWLVQAVVLANLH